ncbi:hypothetical protein FHS85_000678 [Rhodoligotrophos appendicifer]|uniref:M10 family metallopeptidase C-terminal domain-containing protein n=1 Tax=Rhodoligotrophos appendicifer TaxID=987056 RepID=UPI00117F1C3E|nr:M10 family metallopeptidase C-terminal domain-containing protein [Rhodoligotrophos appendicifer]
MQSPYLPRLFPVTATLTQGRPDHCTVPRPADPCASRDAAPRATWETLERVFDGQAEVRGAKVDGETLHREITLDLSGMDGVFSFNLGTMTLERDGSLGGERLELARPDIEIEHVVAVRGMRSLVGDSKNNFLYGSAHSEDLIGGLGRDGFIGGGGRDRFIFTSLEDSSAAAGPDSIYGFTAGVDRIVIQRTEAMKDVGLSWVQGQDFTGGRPEIGILDRGCGWLQVSIDNDGDQRSDFDLMVEAAELSARDFDFV